MTVIVNYRASHDLVTSTSKQLTSGGRHSEKALLERQGRGLPSAPCNWYKMCVAVSVAGWIISGFCSSHITSHVRRSISVAQKPLYFVHKKLISIILGFSGWTHLFFNKSINSNFQILWLPPPPSQVAQYKTRYYSVRKNNTAVYKVELFLLTVELLTRQ